MTPSQASAPRTDRPLVAVRASGRAAARGLLAAIDDVWAAGAAALPLDPTMDGAAARRTASSLAAAALVDVSASGTVRETLPDPVGVPEGTALVVRTSGSTGTPRGVMLSHAALQASVTAGLARLDAQAADRWLAVLPLHHVAGVLVVLRARRLGVEPVVHERFDVARVAAERTVTHVALVPTMLHRMLEREVDVSRFRRVLLGGAAPGDDLLARATAAGAAVTVSYGMTETAGGCVYDGVPLDDVAVAVDPDGRVLLRGPMLADGYRSGRVLTPLDTRDGWLRTADLATWTDGRLTVQGRADDVIVSGGVNVDVRAVGAVIAAHPLVADAAVVGMPDDEWGQRVVATVVPLYSTHPPTTAAIRAHVRDRLGPAAAPREITVVAALPRTALGKVDRAALGRTQRSGRP